MTDARTFLVELVTETLRSPQTAARRLIALDPSMEARWTGLFLVAVLALLETRLALLIMPGVGAGPAFPWVGDPWIGIPVQIVSLLIIAAAMAWVGRGFGGTGNFPDALLLVAWLEFLLTLAQAIQIVALLVVPPLGALIAIAALVLFLWLLVQFTAALHGFTDLLKVFIGMVVSFIVIVTLLAILLTMLGIVPPLTKG